MIGEDGEPGGVVGVGLVWGSDMGGGSDGGGAVVCRWRCVGRVRLAVVGEGEIGGCGGGSGWRWWGSEVGEGQIGGDSVRLRRENYSHKVRL